MWTYTESSKSLKYLIFRAIIYKQHLGTRSLNFCCSTTTAYGMPYSYIQCCDKWKSITIDEAMGLSALGEKNELLIIRKIVSIISET